MNFVWVLLNIKFNIKFVEAFVLTRKLGVSSFPTSKLESNGEISILAGSSFFYFVTFKKSLLTLEWLTYLPLINADETKKNLQEE